MIVHFVSITTESTSAVLWHLFYFYFDKVSPYGVVFALLSKEIQFIIIDLFALACLSNKLSARISFEKIGCKVYSFKIT